jgi:hypothetical protein
MKMPGIEGLMPNRISLGERAIDLDYTGQLYNEDVFRELKGLMREHFTVGNLIEYYRSLATIRLKVQDPPQRRAENRFDLLHVIDSTHRLPEGEKSIYPLGFVNTRPYPGHKYRITVTMRAMGQRIFSPDPMISEAVKSDLFGFLWKRYRGNAEYQVS